MGGFFLRLHRRLLPQHAHIGWTPYLWLFYLIAFYWKWFFVPIEQPEFALTIATTAVFLGLYFDAYWRHGRRVIWNIVAIAAIGAVWSPFNVGAMTFFIYASAFAGMAVRSMRDGFLIIGALAAFLVVEWLIFDLHWAFGFFGGVFTVLIGAINNYYAEVGRKAAELRLSQDEVRQLAAVAERERIARDLHDILGHTLSVITVKSELARKLIERGDSRAGTEIADVERISRDALKQVREAVTGFRRAGLAGELANARLALNAANIRPDFDLAEGPPVQDLASRMGPDLEAVLAMVLREAVTNVIRHAGADHCQVRLASEGDGAVLRVSDDGHGGDIQEGHGLQGMRSRLEDVGGSLSLQPGGVGQRGMTVEARVPLGPVPEPKSEPGEVEP